MGIGLKLLLASLSGFLVTIIFILFFDGGTLIGVIAFYLFAGSVFAAGVLLPYLKREDLMNWRSVALVLISSVSFYCAITAAIEWSPGNRGPNGQDYVIASLIGAAIVLLASPFVLALRYSAKYAFAGLLSAITGGIAFSAFTDMDFGGMFFSFGCWHMLMCISLHIANPVAAEDGWLATVGKTKIGVVVATLSLLVIVPLVDDGIGALLQRRYTAHEGGIRVHEQIEAQGFRDERRKPMFGGRGCGFGCIGPVVSETYAFQEYVIAHAEGRYQLFFIGDRPDPHCYRFGEDWTSPLSPTFTSIPKHDESRCLTYRVNDEPTAEYLVRDFTKIVHTGLGLYSLTKKTQQVIRLSDDNVVAEAVYFTYHSRFFGASTGVVGPWQEFLKQAIPPASGNWQQPE